MSQPFPLSRRSLSIAIGVVFVVLSAVFVLVPYALSYHPWEEARAASANSGRS